MKHVCRHCNSHVDQNQMKAHAAVHNKTLVDKVPVAQMFEEVKYPCPECKQVKMVPRFGKLICQCCSHTEIRYIELK